MCGIFACSGIQKGSAVSSLLKGLKNLEYRGYDSAGVAFFEEGRIRRFRVRGGVSGLEKKLKSYREAKSSLGIGHTRWATHGVPSERNAHPHRSRSVYVAHNGVIENEQEIKRFIHPQKLASDTDTELISHLIDRFYRQDRELGFLQSVFKSLPYLKGSYAVVALHSAHPGELIAFKSGPPLILCRRKKPEKKTRNQTEEKTEKKAEQKSEEFFISSDPYALEQAECEMIFLQDEELLFLKNGEGFKFFNFKGQKLKPKFKKYSFKFLNRDLGQKPHFMIKEILEQPQVIKHLIEDHTTKTIVGPTNKTTIKPLKENHTTQDQIDLKLSKGSKKTFDSLFKSATELSILACGSSYYSALFAKYLLEDVARIKVHVEIASEFIYRKAVLSSKSPALFISQSGETADILSALKLIKQKSLKSLSLCNVMGSSLYRESDFSISMSAGPELAVASTKSFSASLCSLMFLAFYVARLKGESNLTQERSFIKSLGSMEKDMESLLQKDMFFLEIMELLKSFKAFFYLGRGPYWPIALEGALKLKEVAYLHAEAYPSGEIKHGPLAMIDRKTAVVALLPPSGILYQKSLIGIKEVKSRGACIIAIGGSKKDATLKELSDIYFPLPEREAWTHPILSLIPLQMMAYYISRSYGYNADRPRNLAKSVTVE